VTRLSLLSSPSVSQAELSRHLDGLSAEARIAQIEALGKAAQRRLWLVTEGAPAFTLDDLVPLSTPDGAEVIYAGKNSLPLFSRFEKRFMRRGGSVVGYNFGSTRPLVGPGYFTAVVSPKVPSEILFDYTQVPAETPPGWPPVRPNSAGLSRVVFHNLHDFCRRVSKDVLIGSATRLGKEMDSYFVLARR
jgi:hypothetical protein